MMHLYMYLDFAMIFGLSLDACKSSLSTRNKLMNDDQLTQTVAV